jgi:hypothetical protein
MTVPEEHAIHTAVTTTSPTFVVPLYVNTITDAIAHVHEDLRAARLGIEETKVFITEWKKLNFTWCAQIETQLNRLFLTMYPDPAFDETMKKLREKDKGEPLCKMPIPKAAPKKKPSKSKGK